MSYKPIIIDGLAFIIISTILVVSLDQCAKLFEPEKNVAAKLIDHVMTNKMDRFLDSIKLKGVIRERDHMKRTPLMWVVFLNYNALEPVLKADDVRLPYVKVICEHPDVELEARDSDGWTALHWAAWSGMPKCTTLLVTSGASLNVIEDRGFTPLMLAAMRGNYPILEMLLAKGAQYDLKNIDGYTALDLAVQRMEAYQNDFAMICDHGRMKNYEKILLKLKSLPAAPVQVVPIKSDRAVPLQASLSL